MHQTRRRLGVGLLGGTVGLLAMDIVGRGAAWFVAKRAPKPSDVFLTGRTISPGEAYHQPDEGAEALGRILYESIVGRAPSSETKRALSWVVHIAYGLVVAAGYSVIRGSRTPRPLRDGALFGTVLWLFGDELVVPLLGLADQPTGDRPTRHLQSLAQHLGFGVAAVATTRILERAR